MTKATGEKLVLSVSNLKVGLILSFFFLILTLLIPVCVPASKTAFTSPRFYPYTVCILATITSVLFTIVFRDLTYKFDLSMWPQVLGCVIYYLAILLFGFLIATFLTMIFLMRCWAVKSWKITVVMALLTPAAIYLFFTVILNIRLPQGIIFS